MRLRLEIELGPAASEDDAARIATTALITLARTYGEMDGMLVCREAFYDFGSGLVPIEIPMPQDLAKAFPARPPNNS